MARRRHGERWKSLPFEGRDVAKGGMFNLLQFELFGREFEDFVDFTRPPRSV
jgi:hypothetical protein